MGYTQSNLRPPKTSYKKCPKIHHKFLRDTGHGWRIVGLATPLPTDKCRYCGQTRKEATQSEFSKMVCKLTEKFKLIDERRLKVAN